jgi:hypothetical protein
MGEYFVVANLTKREYLDPGKMGGGNNKWRGLLSGGNGVTNVMAMLMAEGNLRYEWRYPKNPNAKKWWAHRGKKSKWIGRWARNKVTIAGDESSAEWIWQKCRSITPNGWTDITLPAIRAYRKLYKDTDVRYRTYQEERKYRQMDIRFEEFGMAYDEGMRRHRRNLKRRRGKNGR